MRHLRVLWRSLVALVTGTLWTRLGRVETSHNILVRQHNALIAEHRELRQFAFSKLDALTKATGELRAELLALADRTADQAPEVEYRPIGDNDDEQTAHVLSERDLFVVGKRESAPR